MGYSVSDLKEKLSASAAASQWSKIAITQHHGIVVPLFSLRSHASCGIGEYLDIIPLIRWCQTLGLDNIQLLPLNDTNDQTSPYSAITAYGLHPIYLSLSQLPYVAEHTDLVQLLHSLQQINGQQRVNYKKVRDGKQQFLQIYFQHVYDQIAQHVDYQTFITDHSWLDDYALFKTLSDKTANTIWELWQEDWKNPSSAMREKLLEQNHAAITYHKFVQYLCYQQMRQVKTFASEQKFLIQGDIPILINRNSADVWSNRSLFNLAYSAGSQPDMYNHEGQNWGFPIYAWEHHETTQYLWWRMRLRYAENFFHLYRLDHVVGFFRIWAIPIGHSSKDGKYLPENPSLWLPQGEKIMRILLDATSMLPIAEDLGTIPNEVRPCLCSLGICGTKVMRWERHWHGDRSLIKIDDYIPESMTTISTHDSETLQLWWQQHPEEAADYCREKAWKYSSTLSLEQRCQLLWDSHHTSSLFHINPLQEYLAMLPELTWENPEDERINIPGTVSDRNWSYRFKPSIEELCANQQLSNLITMVLKP